MLGILSSHLRQQVVRMMNSGISQPPPLTGASRASINQVVPFSKRLSALQSVRTAATSTTSEVSADGPQRRTVLTCDMKYAPFIQMTVRDALNTALDEELARDDKVYILGEEVSL